MFGIHIDPATGDPNSRVAIGDVNDTVTLTVIVSLYENQSEPLVTAFDDDALPVALTKVSWTVEGGTGTWVGTMPRHRAGTFTVHATSATDPLDTATAYIAVIEVSHIAVLEEALGPTAAYRQENLTIFLEGVSRPLTAEADLPEDWGAVRFSPPPLPSFAYFERKAEVDVDLSVSGSNLVCFSCGESGKEVQLTVYDITGFDLEATGYLEQGKTRHYLNLNSEGDAIVALAPVSTPPGAPANLLTISWTGGTAPASGDTSHRIVPSTSGLTTVVGATVDGVSKSVTVHMIDAETPPANTVCPKTPHQIPGNAHIPGEYFGKTWIDIRNTPESYYLSTSNTNRIAAPTFTIEPYFDADRWVFRVSSIDHWYAIGVRGTDWLIPLDDWYNDPERDSPYSFPRYTQSGVLMSTFESLCQARDDLDIYKPTMYQAAQQGPPRSYYWVREITLRHEEGHVNRFYSDEFWNTFMRDFENEVETSYSVVFNCEDSTTISGSAALMWYSSAWTSLIASQHTDAIDAMLSDGLNETSVHELTNPLYAPYRDLILSLLQDLP